MGRSETVRIETSELSAPFDTELWLYNINTTLADVEYSWESPYGNDLIANDDDGAPGSYSLIVQVLDAGTYVIRVSYFSESSASVGD